MTEGCFWINLVQAEQECADAPPEPAAGVQFYGPEGDGSGSGRLCLNADEWIIGGPDGDRPGVCAGSLELVFLADTVVVTGYAPWDWQGGENDPEAANCGAPVPADGYTSISLPMTRDHDDFDDVDQWVYYFSSEGEQPTNGWYYIRLLIDGTTELFGALRRGGGV